MNALKDWARVGGVPPFALLGEPSCVIHGLIEVAAVFKTTFLSFSAKKESFSWGDFSLLDSLWAEFLAVYRFVLMSDVFIGKHDFDYFSKTGSRLYEELANLTSRSRGMRDKVNTLMACKGLAKWQINALSSAGYGALAHEKKSISLDRVKRRELIECIEKKCEKNIANSIELSPVWTGDVKELSGLPDWMVNNAKERASKRGWLGWVFFANYREYKVFMANSDSREMRRRMYQSRSRAGSEFTAGCDNAMLAKRLLSLRAKDAKAASCKSYADYVLSSHMLSDSEKVEEFLLKCADSATLFAFNERFDLEAAVKHLGQKSRLEPWDYRYARAVCLNDFGNGVTSDVSKFFQADKTIQRVIETVGEFLSVKVSKLSEPSVAGIFHFKVESGYGWHGIITIVTRAQSFANDMVAYEWTLSSRSKNRSVVPSSLVFMNLEVGVDGKLMNLAHEDVVNLFHELGHAFHAILGVGRTSIETPENIEADASEFHSQLIENLAWDPKILAKVGHYNGKKMPQRIAYSISSLRNFHSGAWTISQVTDALCDIRLHTKYNPRGKLKPWEVMVAVKKEVSIDKMKSYNRQAQQLGAITGSYVCSDYGYLWSEGLAFRVYESYYTSDASSIVEKRVKLRSVFFDKGSRFKFEKSIELYVGKRPKFEWLAKSRGFI